ncbi:right-handed parallel beta-helix repeat-containing protein, partial [Candidatus Micrarchaeota archaeon]|nr:right-handed parallel beta-helix repeat-containing protein [Candidatus Micrarchaeota archaeon]
LLNIDDDHVYEYTVNGERIKERLAHGQTSDGYVPLLRAQEEIVYYKSGLFTPFSINMSYEEFMTSIEDSDYVIGYSWRTAHGENWLTPVKDQGGCGSCWAFGTIGALEAHINLYYNQHIDVDLSEQDLVSCIGAGGCYGGWPPDTALDYIQETGVVDEECFPYSAWDEPCDDKCDDWSSRVWKITSHSGDIYVYYIHDQLNPGVGVSVKEYYRDLLSNGPLETVIHWWNHCVTGVGFKIFTNYGINAIEIKNSWSDDWGDDGYAYILQFSGLTYQTIGDVIPPSGTSHDVECRDNDGDGYCWWGIGEKPSTCPASCAGNDKEDCNDSDPNKNELINGYICIDSSHNIDSCKVLSSPGIYLVTENITSTSSVCLDVQSDDVIILGEGYKIRGTGAEGTKGIRINGHHNVYIKDLIIENFGTGLDLENAGDVTAKYLIINESGVGIRVYNSDSNKFKLNRILNCDIGVGVIDSDDNRFEGNYVRYSETESLHLEGSSNNWFYYNTFCGDGEDVNVVSGTNQFNGTVCSSSSSVCEQSCSEGYDCVNLYWPDSYLEGLSFDRGLFTLDSVSEVTLCNITYFLDKDTHLIVRSPSSYATTINCNGALFTSDFNTYPYDPVAGQEIGYADVGLMIVSQATTVKNCNFVNVPTPIVQLLEFGNGMLIIENNSFENISGVGTAIYIHDANFIIRNNRFRNIGVDNPNEYYYNYGAIFLHDYHTYYSSPNLIANNTFYNTTPICNDFYSNTCFSSPLHIVNNTFENPFKIRNRRYVIWFDHYYHPLYYVSIYNNRFINGSIRIPHGNSFQIRDNYFLSQDSGAAQSVIFFSGYDSLIYNNTIICNHNLTCFEGILLEWDSGNNNISRNYIESAFSYGIKLDDTTNSYVEDNVILNSGSLGLYMHSSSSNNHIEHNVICGSGSDDIVEYGSSNEYIENYCETSYPDGLCTATRTYYYDGDSDTYGVDTMTEESQCPSSGYTWRTGDCDDLNATVHPGAEEVCDGVDQDCDGLFDEDFDSDGDGYTTCGYNITTGEYIEHDCLDDPSGDPPGCPTDPSGCDPGCPSDGTSACAICVNPGHTTECCDDSVDNNCDGLLDDEDPDCVPLGIDIMDMDGDGYNVYVDCDDLDPTVHPGAFDRLNGRDDDCDGLIDEDVRPGIKPGYPDKLPVRVGPVYIQQDLIRRG